MTPPGRERSAPVDLRRDGRLDHFDELSSDEDRRVVARHRLQHARLAESLDDALRTRVRYAQPFRDERARHVRRREELID